MMKRFSWNELICAGICAAVLSALALALFAAVINL
jgi:hypothetical protein